MNPRAKTNPAASLIYNALLKVSRRATRIRIISGMWWKAWNRAQSRFPGPIRTVVHGRQFVANNGNTYPLYIRLHPSYNTPLIEVVHLAYEAKGSPICYVDIGAATGDSILLVHANCPGEIAATYCVDGDDEFLDYLRVNTADIPGCKIRRAMLSAAGSKVRELVRVHGGTASSIGSNTVDSSTLDAVIAEDRVGPVDVLKIDVDGYDGQILRGAPDVLRRDRPAVIFEWHPPCCASTGNDPTDHFKALDDAGYDRFVWFTKTGEFSHFMLGYDKDDVDLLARLCLETKVYSDMHYDVIALHPDSQISPLHLADLMYARGRRYPL